jgi:hypothetical protein
MYYAVVKVKIHGVEKKNVSKEGPKIFYGKTPVSPLKKKKLEYETRTPQVGKGVTKKRTKEDEKTYNLNDMSPPSFSLDFSNQNAKKERTPSPPKKKQLRKTPPSVVCLNDCPIGFDFEEPNMNDCVKEYFNFND